MKTLTSSLKYFIVQKAGISNKEALAAILSGRVLVNGEKGSLLQELQPEDLVELDGQVLKNPETFLYLAYYKPRGIESTLNPGIENNLAQALDLPQRVFPVGRLDKESEGLMLLTNDGGIFDQVIHAESHQEKQYQVTVDKPLSREALEQLEAGVVILGRKTRPAIVRQVAADTFAIILTQGLNRQIRRMCYKLGYQVEKLVRTRLVNLELGTLTPGEWRHLSTGEIRDLKQKVESRAGSPD
ncbi:MAG: pseudouridine synthase [Adhaeribacter sp.]